MELKPKIAAALEPAKAEYERRRDDLVRQRDEARERVKGFEAELAAIDRQWQSALTEVVGQLVGTPAPKRRKPGLKAGPPVADRIVKLLADNDGTMDGREMSAALRDQGVKGDTISQTRSKLVRRGILSKVADPQNGRTVQYSLTKEGWKAAGKHPPSGVVDTTQPTANGE